MDLDLKGKRAFVSGSTQGIGYAVARSLAAEGATVVLNGRDAAKVDAAVLRLLDDVEDADVAGIPADFRDATQVARLLDELGEVDVLVNNVGLFEVAQFEGIADDDWQTYLDVNLMSGVRLSRQLLPGMLERGWGRIVFVSSESGVNVPADMIHYGVTKAAMLALGNGLAKRTKGSGVTVNTVLGGPTFSDGVASAVGALAAQWGVDADVVKSQIADAHPTSLLGRFLEPEEIAHLVTYLASPLASATNGAALRADGGALTTLT